MGKEGIINLHQNLHQNLYHNLLQNLCHDVHHHKKNTEVAVNDILPDLNKEAIAEVKVILQICGISEHCLMLCKMTQGLQFWSGVNPVKKIKVDIP